MGGLSNQLLVVTIVSYALAMLAYAVEYAFGGRSVVARVATRELVGAGGPSISESELVASPVVPPSGARYAGVAGVGLTVLGFVAHLAAVVTRGIAAGRAPWGNMYEFVMMATLVGLAAWLIVLTKWRNVRHLGLFVTLVAAILLSIAGMTLYVQVGPLVPALHSYWLVIHVGAASISSGIFLVGFVAAAMHLIRSGYDNGKRNFPYSLGERLPQAGTLERVTFRVHAFAFPIWTFGVITGAIWAEAAWGRYWNWDPKEVWSFVAWVVYACYLHARSTPSVSRRVSSWIAVAGWATMLINLFGVNLVASGLHSYAGV
ncbi:c-type cytochrome biogenesis protein CcsB [Dactylosporangium sucinum]|uniref:C-type cytochrome biogenesis protein CcsB n=1 Tax=Dactylosporangium sucinum TaxID=1424081 RepID=A0A917U993_9ACTN|nr:c-type cytochrome biogenesis protein CcsB [Dactylosporangium sucinum]GGM63590.1 c-type cytochrome biogenesis protein CcsB [Dactylosporangium sucinum]